MTSNGWKLTQAKVFWEWILSGFQTNKMIILILKHFMKNYNIKNNTINESFLQRVHNFPINPRYSKINSVRGFVNIDNGSMGGNLWVVFYKKPITNPITQKVSEEVLINFYLSNYQNQKVIINKEFKI